MYFWLRPTHTFGVRGLCILSPGKHNLKQMELHAAHPHSAAGFGCPAGNLHPLGNLLTLSWKLTWYPLSPSGGINHPTNKDLLMWLFRLLQVSRVVTFALLGRAAYEVELSSEQLKERAESVPGREQNPKPQRILGSDKNTPNYSSYFPIICSFVIEQSNVPGNTALYITEPAQSIQWITLKVTSAIG